jgi:dihydrofolate reductase
MRRITVFNMMSLDGYIADARGDMSWRISTMRSGMNSWQVTRRVPAFSSSAGLPTR